MPPISKKKKKKSKKTVRKNNNRNISIRKGLLKSQSERVNVCPSIRPFESQFDQQISTHLIKSNEEFKKKIAKQLLQKFSPTNISMKDDFYHYINFSWLKGVSVNEQQKYIVQIDEFRLSQDRVYKELDAIIVEYIEKHQNKLAQELHHFRTSVIQMNSQKDSCQRAQQTIQMVDTIREHGTVWKMLANINRDEMIARNAPFSWSMNPDEKRAGYYCCYIYPHAFSFTDIDVYFNQETEYSKKYIRKFKQYCREIFHKLLGPNHGFKTDSIFEVEVQLVMAFGCRGSGGDLQKTYNKISKKEAMDVYGFDWDLFCQELGFTTTPSFFIVSSLQYLKCATRTMNDHWNSEGWRAYWMWIYFQRLIRITRDWESITYKFHGDFQRGQQKINHSDSVSASLYMSIPFNTFLTNEYIRKYKDPTVVGFAKTLCEELKIVFVRIIKRNKWMSPSTKKYALLKLKHMEFIIGNVPELREDPLLNYTTNLYDNMKKIHEWRHRQLLKLDGQPLVDIPMMDWNEYPVKMSGNQSYIVNASYTPTKNNIFINLGYLQKPFIDLEQRGIEYNLANLGATIAHELSHSLDEWGSKYDFRGNLHNWWTPSDMRKFKNIQKDINDQYREFSQRDGIEYNVEIGIGENMADISAIAICDEYLRDFQEMNDTHPAVRSLSYEAFYTYYAHQMRQHVNKRALSAQLKNNPHALDVYRTNIPLSRSHIFRALYNIQKEDKMYWRNTNTIW
jgi:putative endopeptidase